MQAARLSGHGRSNRDRVFKVPDLVSLIYRYVPPNLIVDVTERHLAFFESAFSHRSADRSTSYERQEFLGDAIGTAILTAYLFHRFPNEDEAFLTRLRSYLISGKVLQRGVSADRPPELGSTRRICRAPS